MLAIKLVSVIGAAVDMGKAFGTLATTKPAECFAVSVVATCGDSDEDGLTPLPKPLLGCTVQTGDCNDGQKAQHPGVAQLCDLARIIHHPLSQGGPTHANILLLHINLCTSANASQ